MFSLSLHSRSGNPERGDRLLSPLYWNSRQALLKRGTQRWKQYLQMLHCYWHQLQLLT